ncbi:MAG TPA: hypothetical protein EYQ54_19000 [Myxococcales bacterium]|nr:hypothetical protein [Myxococcales bacterium]
MNSQTRRQVTDRGRSHRWMILASILFLLSGPASANDFGAGAEAGSFDLEEEFGLDALEGFDVAEESELSESRGGEATAISLQDMRSNVDGNVVSGNVTTGSVSIGENAFSDFDGISSVVVNSGNNVSIQSSTVVNVIIGD